MSGESSDPSTSITTPHVPTTATSLWGWSARASACARWTTGMPSARAATRSRLSSSIAVETITSSGSSPSNRLPSSGRQATPRRRRNVMFLVSRLRSLPVTSSPSFTSAVASALIPTPPMPIKWCFIKIKWGPVPAPTLFALSRWN